ncbi:hypothetical protein D8B29_18665, partial [Verminephrobacter eiseniae]|nr:hypothetical protein [Verminephrobacter eiseniae]
SPASAARPPEGGSHRSRRRRSPVRAARPPEGAHTAAEGEGLQPAPPEGAHTVAEREGTPVSTVRPASMAIRSRFR